ncbi:MAG: RNA polymerase sigma factor, partial [Eubacteriales bacterium]|nr:RNA polymerase sigma factor [Eubacteriales bacterium]
ADRKHKQNNSVSGADIESFELESDIAVENEYVQNEELSLLRRELAFISSDYRDIVVAYYFDDLSVKDIANTLSLTEGTVKIRLFRARNILKEGIKMAREFGTKSYKPEQVSFVNSCSSFGDNGQPWTILTHSLYKNIFLEVYDNPETAAEVSLALGIALPYMEDELKFLTEQTFLMKEGDKYKTSFPIISAEAQRLMYEKNISVTAGITSLLETLIDKFSEACRESGSAYYGDYQDYEDAKWTLLMRTFDWLSSDACDGDGSTKREYTVRPDNGRWDIVGYQDAKLPEPLFIGLHGVFNERPDKPAVHFQQFKYNYENIESKTPNFLSHDEALTLKMVAEGKWEACEKLYIDNLLKYGYIRNNGDGFVPTILVFSGYSTDKYTKKFTEAQKSEIIELAHKIKKIFADVESYSTDIVAKDIPQFVGAGKMYSTYSTFERGYVLEQALRDGWIKYDETTSNVIGAYLYI